MRYNGRYILIKDSADAGVFDTFEDAMMEAVSCHYEPGTFIVQLCTANPDAAVQKFYSRAVFA